MKHTSVPIGDPRYPALVRGFNQRWVGRPSRVVVCTDTESVVSSVQDALDAGLRITVKSGGHCYEDFAVGNDGGVLLDLSSMAQVHRDEATGLYGVGPGALLWDVYRWLLANHNVTLPGGSCWSVGAGGHVLGGGYGILSRRDGLIVDYLEAVEVCVVDANRRAEMVLASRSSLDADLRSLLWAHQGGGGGNFGVVTKLWFKDPPTPPIEAMLAHLDWPWESLDRGGFAALVRAHGAFIEAHSSVESPEKHLDTALELRHRAGGSVSLSAIYVGDEPERFEDFLRWIKSNAPAPRGGSRPFEVEKLPWLHAAHALAGADPGLRSKYKSAFMLKAVPDWQIDVLWDHLTSRAYENPTAAVSVNDFGCQINAVDPAATAAVHRSSVLLLQYGTTWNDPAADPEHLDWLRGFYRAMYGERGPMPDALVDGCFLNYPDVDLGDWQTLYYKDNYPRLREVKSRWDPLDVFHHAQSIELVGSAASSSSSLP